MPRPTLSLREKWPTLVGRMRDRAERALRATLTPTLSRRRGERDQKKPSFFGL